MAVACVQVAAAFGQPATQATARLPQVAPTPLSAPAPQEIFIDAPSAGTLVGSPVVITGRTARLPKNGLLSYRFTNSAGQQLGAGQLRVDGAPGQLIDTPSPGTAVGSPMVLTGWTARSPYGGNLNYRVINNAGQQIGAGAFPVGGAPGYPRGYNAELFFDLPINGDTIRVELYDWNASSGTTEASQSIYLMVLPTAQQIFLDSPPPGTLVGSPVVITGRTTRFPFDGDLSYRFTDGAGSQLGAGTFQVFGQVDQPTTFNASLTFTLPNNGGLVHLEVYDHNPDDGAIVASSGLDLDVLAQYQAIFIDTPPPGTQVGSPMVLGLGSAAASSPRSRLPSHPTAAISM
jgi:hypothetical protein